MKKREKKALELIDKGTQARFVGIPENVKDEKITAKRKGRRPPTYWRCEKDHIFVVKHRIDFEREKTLRCTECGAKIRNAVNRRTYLYYLDNCGRGNKKQYRKLSSEKN